MVVLNIPFLDLKRQNSFVREPILEEISQLSESCAFIKSHHVQRFEEAFRQFTESNYCLGVGNGTDALEIALEAMELEVGSEVILPANTFVASAEAIIRSGLIPVFCDVNPRTYLMDCESIIEHINERTSAVLVVHLYGQVAPIDEILNLCKPRGIKIIEDAAQAHGAKLFDQTIGAYSDCACFSFYPGKNLGAWGDAGAIVFNQEKIYQRAELIANHGSKIKYQHDLLGRNSRLDAIQAIVLYHKLPLLNQWNQIRRDTAKQYRHLLNAFDIKLQEEINGASGVYHLMIAEVDRRDELLEHLQSQGIGVGLHYPQIIPHMKPFLKYSTRDYIHSANLSKKILSLPMGEHMNSIMVESVVNSIRDFYLS